ncbi:MAG: stage III sporulation protein AG [Bacillus sp. (in: firmicutes)]
MKEEKPQKRLLNQLFRQNPSGDESDKGKKPSLYFYMLAVLAIGVIIMMGSEFLAKEQEKTSTVTALPAGGEDAKDVETFGQSKNNTDKTITDYERTYENQIKEALESINGVSDVTVVVNVDATEQRIFEKKKVTHKQTTDEIDREGGKRTVEDSSVDEQPIIVRDGEKEVPIIQETKKPVIRGVLVVAKGADNITIKKWIVEAVTRSLDVSSHRVAVMPKK